MNQEELAMYEHMWKANKDNYMLMEVEGDGERKRYSIIDIQSNHGVIIEDNKVAEDVVRRMLAAGVPVGNPFDPETRKQIIKRRMRSSRATK